MKKHLLFPVRRFIPAFLALIVLLGCNLPLVGQNATGSTQAVPTQLASPAATQLATQPALPTAIPSTPTSPAPTLGAAPVGGVNAQWPAADPVYSLKTDPAI